MDYLTVDLLCIIVAVATFVIVICSFIIQHYISSAKHNKQDRWLLSDWQEDIYELFLSKKDAMIIAKSFGINANKYIHDCYLIKEKPKLKKVIIERITGIIVFILFLVLFIFTRSVSMILVGIAISFPLSFMSIYATKNKANKRKITIAEELPRFMDLLYTALIIDVPIIQALKITAEYLPNTILSKEIMLALADTQMGIVSWQSALEKLSNDYQIESLSEFVMEIINAYNNGVSVAEAVKIKSNDIKQSNILHIKERAKKMTSTILFPIMVFKIMPILLILCVPVIEHLNGSGFGL